MDRRGERGTVSPVLSTAQGMLVLAVMPVGLFVVRHRPWMVCSVALAGCVLPFLLTAAAPEVRSLVAVVTFVLFFRSLEFAAGRVRPQGWIDFLFFTISIMSVVRWETRRQPDRRRAARALVTGLLQFGLAWLLVLIDSRIDEHNLVRLVTSQLEIYLLVAGLCNLTQVKLALRGLDYDDGFNNPLVSRTPAEFWGRRWNTLISDMLYRYVFLPAGGRRHPVRGVLAAFGASGALHELIVYAGTLQFNGGMCAYFGVQGGLVATTSRSRFVRRLARERPVVAWAFTMVLMLGTGALFLRGLDAADPSHAWRRVFGPN